MNDDIKKYVWSARILFFLLAGAVAFIVCDKIKEARETERTAELYSKIRAAGALGYSVEDYSADFCLGYWKGNEDGLVEGRLERNNGEYDQGYEDGSRAGYKSAANEFCYQGDPQYGGWDEGYKAGREDYRRDIFNDTQERQDFMYDFFETYCDDTAFSDYVDDVYVGWRKYMSKGRALR